MGKSSINVDFPLIIGGSYQLTPAIPENVTLQLPQFSVASSDLLYCPFSAPYSMRFPVVHGHQQRLESTMEPQFAERNQCRWISSPEISLM